MFGRVKTPQPAQAEPAAPVLEPARPGAKGRPTPRRREAEQRNRRPLVAPAPPRPPKGASRADRKAFRAQQRETALAERQRRLEGIARGDDAYLPQRDRGPARAFARDYVDARRNVAELFIPAALILLLASFALNAVDRALGALVGSALYLLLLVVLLDSLVLRRRIARAATAKYGDAAAGAATYGMMRATQLRRFRQPPVRVARGQYPS